MNKVASLILDANAVTSHIQKVQKSVLCGYMSVQKAVYFVKDYHTMMDLKLPAQLVTIFVPNRDVEKWQL